MIDLDKVIVITGFAKVDPWDSSWTCWEMEARGEFTIEGCIDSEMAWMIGYIKHFDGRLKDGTLHVGWIDSKTHEPVDDKGVKGRHERDILDAILMSIPRPESRVHSSRSGGPVSGVTVSNKLTEMVQ
jgi:fatty acid synthase subunit beta